MRVESLIDRLTSELKPVHRRTAGSDALALVALCAVELGLFFGMGMMRSDMPIAMHLPSFWWKFASFGLIGLVSGAVTIMSLDPERSPRRGLRLIAALIAVCFVGGWLVNASHDGLSTVVGRLHWIDGLECCYNIMVLSVPAVIGLGLLMRRAAPTDQAGTALAAGLTAAALGAFVFVFACRFDDPLHVAVWFSLGCGAVTLFARFVLPRFTRW
jgi:hypothetical protein